MLRSRGLVGRNLEPHMGEEARTALVIAAGLAIFCLGAASLAAKFIG